MWSDDLSSHACYYLPTEEALEEKGRYLPLL